AVDLDGGFSPGLRLPERGDDALGARQLLGGGQVRAVHRADLIGVHAQPTLEAAAPAPLERPPEGFRLLEVKPRAVDRVLHAGGAFRLGQHHAVDAFVNGIYQIAVAKLRGWSIHSHVTAHAPRLPQGLRDPLARRRLVRWGHRILEIEDHRVGFQGQRLLYS